MSIKNAHIFGISESIQESISYWIDCDRCNGHFEIEEKQNAYQLYDLGWRIIDKEGVVCPNCLNPSPCVDKADA